METKYEKQFIRQSTWQKKRKSLSWKEKLRQSIRVRNSARLFMYKSKKNV